MSRRSGPVTGLFSNWTDSLDRLSQLSPSHGFESAASSIFALLFHGGEKIGSPGLSLVRAAEGQGGAVAPPLPFCSCSAGPGGAEGEVGVCLVV